MPDPAEFDSVIDHCKKLEAASQHATVDPEALRVAKFLLDTLGTEFPCGFSVPRIGKAYDGPVVIMDDFTLGSRSEALGIAAAIIRCALSLPPDQGA